MNSRRASIDLGTNTCLLLVAEWDEKQKKVHRVLDDRISYVRLGQGVDQKKELHPDAMERAMAALVSYSETVTLHGIAPASVICVATSQARDARNGADFFRNVQERTGFRFRTISGDDEARLTFVGGLLPQHDSNRSVVIDIGGGSTEFMALSGGKSLDMGSVRFTERFLKSDPVIDSEFWACREEIDRLLESMKPWRASLPAQSQLVGVAGTVTTIAAWNLGLTTFVPSKIDGAVLARGDVHRFVEELKWRSLSERQAMPGVDEKRADVILAGGMILWRAMEMLDFSELVVSTRGLRYGVMELS